MTSGNVFRSYGEDGNRHARSEHKNKTNILNKNGNVYGTIDIPEGIQGQKSPLNILVTFFNQHEIAIFPHSKITLTFSIDF